MAILSDDIKLRESERMTDSTDGGGRRTLAFTLKESKRKLIEKLVANFSGITL